MREWQGLAWRIHRARYAPMDTTGAQMFSGRYHRARKEFPQGRVWPALYTSLNEGACIAEAVRHAGDLQGLTDRRMTQFRIGLNRVLDLRNPSDYGLRVEDVTDDSDYSRTQELALAALERGAEGLLVPAASLVGDNLVIFIDSLVPHSVIHPIRFIDPKLYVGRS
jgi:RES domain-containing protein